MTTSRPTTEFTIRLANQTLPLVRMIVEDIVELSKEVSETLARLEYLTDGRNYDACQDEYSKELSSIEQVTELKSAQVDEFIQELAALHAIPAGATDGFVDFPASREEESVCLCWRLGEKEVMYWHGRNESCAQRRLVDLPLIRQSGEQHQYNTA